MNELPALGFYSAGDAGSPRHRRKWNGESSAPTDKSPSMTTEIAQDPGHAPVLLEEAMEFLAPTAGGVYCDATVGLGGHSAAILQRSSPDGRLIGIDRDRDALAKAGANVWRRLATAWCCPTRASDRSATVLESAGTPLVDGCLVDLGVSSMQLDRAERGFSFRHSGPLDMRMDQSQGETAADFLRRADEEEIERILRDLGEERFARKIARTIVEARDSDRLIDHLRAVAAHRAHHRPARAQQGSRHANLSGPAHRLERRAGRT
jgi:16S rRNA (cytosine1402-N4)-methyltransferase